MYAIAVLASQAFTESVDIHATDLLAPQPKVGTTTVDRNQQAARVSGSIATRKKTNTTVNQTERLVDKYYNGKQPKQQQQQQQWRGHI